jgi:hypothetical protein
VKSEVISTGKKKKKKIKEEADEPPPEYDAGWRP